MPMHKDYVKSGVLIVDDDKTTLDFLSHHLEREGYPVFQAATGAQALEIVSREEVGVVLLDFYLPDTSGQEVCSRLKAQAQGQYPPAVLIMSAMAGSMQMAGSLGLGADDYLHKPVAPDVLLPRVWARNVARQAKMELKHRGHSLCMILDSIQEMLLYISPDYEIRWVNDLVVQETGQELSQIIGLKCHDVLRSHSSPCPDCPIVSTFTHGEPQQEVVQVQNERYWHYKGYPLLEPNGDQFGVVLLALDITQQEKHKQQIEYLALHDPMTGLKNRTFFITELERVLSQGQRYTNNVGILYLDLNEFKQINDTLGHSVGDAVLQETAACIQNNLRQSDMAARLGGDEFVVALPQMKNHEEAEHVAQKILQNLGQTSLNHQGVCLYIKASIGLAVFPEHGTDVDRLLTKADKAMYRAKRTSKRYVWCDSNTPKG